MSLERLDEAFRRYSSHLESVKKRSLEDAKARLISEHTKYVDELNKLFDEAVNAFEKKLKS